MSTKKRTDPHRKGAIIPAEYTHVLSYNGGTTKDGWPVPAFGINCTFDRRVGYDKDDHPVSQWDRTAVRHVDGQHDADGQCCVVGLMQVAKAKFASHGTTGKCTACGAQFVYGEVWRHEPTGEHIHVGHICGTKYGLLADRSAFELEAGRRAQAAAIAAQKAVNAEKRKAFLEAHEGLEKALETPHRIVGDIKRRFEKFCTLSDKQIALVYKLAAEETAPKVCDHCHGDHELDDCPERTPLTDGRQELCGRILSVQAREEFFGTSLKMLVLLTTGAKVWGTLPQSLCSVDGILRGKTVQFTAQVTAKDQFFGFFSRPTRASVVQ